MEIIQKSQNIQDLKATSIINKFKRIWSEENERLAKMENIKNKKRITPNLVSRNSKVVYKNNQSAEEFIQELKEDRIKSYTSLCNTVQEFKKHKESFERKDSENNNNSSKKSEKAETKQEASKEEDQYDMVEPVSDEKIWQQAQYDMYLADNPQVQMFREVQFVICKNREEVEKVLAENEAAKKKWEESQGKKEK